MSDPREQYFVDGPLPTPPDWIDRRALEIAEQFATDGQTKAQLQSEIVWAMMAAAGLLRRTND